MPNQAAARNLRRVTPGAEAAAPAPQYPRTAHGPSANSRAKAKRAQETRAAAVATGGVSADLGAALSAGAEINESTPLFGLNAGSSLSSSMSGYKGVVGAGGGLGACPIHLAI
jgi:hypothetical protein